MPVGSVASEDLRFLARVVEVLAGDVGELLVDFHRDDLAIAEPPGQHRRGPPGPGADFQHPVMVVRGEQFQVLHCDVRARQRARRSSGGVGGVGGAIIALGDDREVAVHRVQPAGPVGGPVDDPVGLIRQK